MYDLELLRKFCTVAKCRSFTKASEELYISQPALSKSIKVLEEQMGILLFERNNKKVELTKEGKILYNLINERLNYICNIDPMIESLKEGPQHTLSIGASATITHNIVIPALKNFLDKHHEINLIVKNKATPELIEQLEQKELDMVVINLPIDNMDKFDIIVLKEVQDVFFANSKYSYLKNKELNATQLESLPIITNIKRSVVRENFDNYCLENNLIITPHIETVRNSLITDFCILGLGVGFSTYEFISKQIEKNDLFVLDINPKIPSRSIGIVTRKEPKTEIIEKLINELLKKS